MNPAEQASTIHRHPAAEAATEVARLTEALTAARAEAREQVAAASCASERLESLLKLLPAGVVVLASDGTVDEFNPVAESLLGSLAHGEPWRNVVARAFAPRPDDGHDISLASGKRVHLETSVLEQPGARGTGQILMLTDVTRTRALQEQLAHHKRLSAKTEMAAALAHQVRTPLATAMLYAGQFKGEGNGNGERLIGALRSLETLVDDMLLFARGGSLEAEEVAVADLVAALAQATDAFMAQTGYHTRIDADDLSGTVRVNLPVLVNVLMNLVKNAEEITRDQALLPEGEPDMVITVRAGDWLTLAFADRGPGVPAAVRESIFEPFVTSGKKGKGTGLGLPVTRSVVRSLGGELLLDDSYTDGACFAAHFPLVSGTSTNNNGGENV